MIAHRSHPVPIARSVAGHRRLPQAVGGRLSPVACRLSPVCLSFFFLVSCTTPGSTQALTGPTLPSPPVQMTLPRLDGGTLSIESLRGRPVLLTLFTTWWVPCQGEAPTFVRFDERFRQDGLAVVGVALDEAGKTPAQLVRLWVDEMGIRYPVLLAPPNDLELVGGVGQTKAVPRTLLLDRQGRIILDQVGKTRFQALEIKVLELLGKR
jgi:peroxiredoxin